MVDILDDGGNMKVVEDVVNREIVVIEVLSSVSLVFYCANYLTNVGEGGPSMPHGHLRWLLMHYT
jgi:hypothetical protein